ncbi:hypothetical protein RRG08_019028 [Elysia crispata]|uniref:Uncharacterized protein n=1 Tax=Elysia crispata TaxID=231223 RepID=A0AAE1A5L1_9GAST|nr:hypothetical protein RRG08_019028 [Elysia crispata]
MVDRTLGLIDIQIVASLCHFFSLPVPSTVPYNLSLGQKVLMGLNAMGLLERGDDKKDKGGKRGSAVVAAIMKLKSSNKDSDYSDDIDGAKDAPELSVLKQESSPLIYCPPCYLPGQERQILFARCLSSSLYRLALTQLKRLGHITMEDIPVCLHSRLSQSSFIPRASFSRLLHPIKLAAAILSESFNIGRPTLTINKSMRGCV